MQFQQPYHPESALSFLSDALQHGTAGDGVYTERCRRWLESELGALQALMTTSCTHALELALQILDLQPGDEVIVPSFTYPSTANAVLLAGGTVVYGEVEPHHLTLAVDRLPLHITERTKAVIAVHYGGNCCDMEALMAVAGQHRLCVIEDGAQSFLSTFGGRPAGTWGHLGCLSFHATKDIIAGEGGALLVNDPVYGERAETFRQKGTNAGAYHRGLVNRYEWVGRGSSYSPSELCMALLCSQLESSGEILPRRQRLFAEYEAFFNSRCYDALCGWSRCREKGQCNGHLYYIIFRETETADRYGQWLQQQDIPTRTHFVPLHESVMGRRFVRPQNDFEVETGLGSRLVRLPLHAGLSEADQRAVLSATEAFFQGAV